MLPWLPSWLLTHCHGNRLLTVELLLVHVGARPGLIFPADLFPLFEIREIID